MRVLDVIHVRGRGFVVVCIPDRIVTMNDVRSPGLRLVRKEGDGRDGRTWRVLGVERKCVAPRVGEETGLLIEGEEIEAGDEIGIEAGDEIGIEALL